MGCREKKLSTPSLGITGHTFAEGAREALLSTPSLGITIPSLPFPHFVFVVDFQLPLSGSRGKADGPAEALPESMLSTPSLGITVKRRNFRPEGPRGPFNSLSRDHTLALEPKTVCFLWYFQLPLSGSPCESEERAREGVMGFQLPLSGSRRASHPRGAFC